MPRWSGLQLDLAGDAQVCLNPQSQPTLSQVPPGYPVPLNIPDDPQA